MEDWAAVHRVYKQTKSKRVLENYHLLDEANKNKQDNPFEKRTDKSEEMEKLIHELIGERLLELSRYISINSISKTLIIDKTSLIRDGYISFH